MLQEVDEAILPLQQKSLLRTQNHRMLNVSLSGL